MMKRLMIGTAALAMLAGTGTVYARSITSSPEATMTEQQKLGPNAHTRMFRGGGYVTHRGHHAYRAAPVYGAYGGGNVAYGYEPSYSYYEPSYSYGYAPGYAYGYGGAYGYGPGISVGIGW